MFVPIAIIASRMSNSPLTSATSVRKSHVGTMEGAARCRKTQLSSSISENEIFDMPTIFDKKENYWMHVVNTETKELQEEKEPEKEQELYKEKELEKEQELREEQEKEKEWNQLRNQKK